MITLIQSLPVGNAARIFIDPPNGSIYWRLLRRTSDAFTGQSDQGAVLVADQSTDNAIVDGCGLTNGTTYFWHDYHWDGSSWIDGGTSKSATPDATYGWAGPDVQEIVRERLALALAVEVARGRLIPQSGLIEVTKAPFMLADGIKFPTVSVHVDRVTPAEFGIGAGIAPGLHDFSVTPDVIDESEGWLEQWSLSIVGVSLNADERATLRESIRRAVIANLGVFASVGITNPTLTQQDAEEFSERNAPLYRTESTFTCLAPTAVTAVEQTITDVTVSATINEDTVYA